MAGSAAVMYILISRLSGAELLGQYSLAFAWINLAGAFASFGVSEFVMREIGRAESDAGIFFGNGLLIALVTTSVASGLILILSHFPGYDVELIRALMYGTLALWPIVVTEICRGTFLALRRADLVMIIALVDTSLILTINVYLLTHGHGIAALMLTVAAGKTASCTLALLFYSKVVGFNRIEFSVDRCREFIGPISAFGASRILGIFSQRLNIIMLSFWTSATTIGLYASATKIMELMVILPSIFAQVLLPRIAHAFATQDRPDTTYGPEFHLLFSLTIPLGGGVIIFADRIIALLFGDAFTGSVVILRILALFFLIEVLDTMLSTLNKGAGRQSQDVRYFCLHPVMNAIFNLFLIPLAGGVGAAIGRIAGGLSSTLVRLAYPAISMRWWPFIRTPAGVTLVAAGAVWMLLPEVSWIVAAAGYIALTGAALYGVQHLTSVFASQRKNER